MKSLQTWLDEYGESHQNATNKRIHFVAVPVIFLTVMGLLWSIPTPQWLASSVLMNWLIVAMIPAMGFYLMLSFKLGLAMTLITAVFYALLYYYDLHGPTSVLWMSVVLFVIMWILQFYGHKVEGKKPSFFKDLAFLLIGPAWIMHWTLKKFNLSL